VVGRGAQPIIEHVDAEHIIFWPRGKASADRPAYIPLETELLDLRSGIGAKSAEGLDRLPQVAQIRRTVTGEIHVALAYRALESAQDASQFRHGDLPGMIHSRWPGAIWARLNADLRRAVDGPHAQSIPVPIRPVAWCSCMMLCDPVYYSQAHPVYLRVERDEEEDIVVITHYWGRQQGDDSLVLERDDDPESHLRMASGQWQKVLAAMDGQQFLAPWLGPTGT